MPLLVVCGPSGVGKGTLLNKLIAVYPQMEVLISHTTRNPRKGEKHGKEYYFVSNEEFNVIKAQDGFLEWAEFADCQYGTSKAEIRRAEVEKKIGILEIEINGVRQVQANSHIDARYVFIKPPSIDDLKKRLLSRGTETDAAILRRINASIKEIPAMTKLRCDHEIVNDLLEDAFQSLKNYVKREFNLND